MVFGWLALCILFETCQQVSFTVSGRRQNFQKWLWLITGVLFYLLQLALWLWVLTQLPLGIAAPLMAATYITVPLASRFLFHEALDRRRALGMAIIFLGLVLIACFERSSG